MIYILNTKPFQLQPTEQVRGASYITYLAMTLKQDLWTQDSTLNWLAGFCRYNHTLHVCIHAH